MARSADGVADDDAALEGFQQHVTRGGVDCTGDDQVVRCDHLDTVGGQAHLIGHVRYAGCGIRHSVRDAARYCADFIYLVVRNVDAARRRRTGQSVDGCLDRVGTRTDAGLGTEYQFGRRHVRRRAVRIDDRAAGPETDRVARRRDHAELDVAARLDQDIVVSRKRARLPGRIAARLDIRIAALGRHVRVLDNVARVGNQGRVTRRRHAVADKQIARRRIQQYVFGRRDDRVHDRLRPGGGHLDALGAQTAFGRKHLRVGCRVGLGVTHRHTARADLQGLVVVQVDAFRNRGARNRVNRRLDPVAADTHARLGIEHELRRRHVQGIRIGVDDRRAALQTDRVARRRNGAQLDVAAGHDQHIVVGRERTRLPD